jgi:vitamin B12 transporter
MKTLYSLSALALACVTAAHTFANEKMEEVLVTSSRVEMPLRQIGTSVSVITQATIQQRGFNSLFEVLRSEPSVAVSNVGGAGQITSLRIRGEECFRTLVLLDGIDVSDTSGTQVGPRFEHLMSSGIARVEILRGPQGLMYGADAGGVVNISSLSPQQGLGGSVSAEGGEYGTRDLAGTIAAGNESGDIVVSASSFETDGFNARTTDNLLRDDDGYENTTAHAKAGWNVTEDLRLEAVLRNVNTETEYDGCNRADFSPTDVCSDDYDATAWRLAADYSVGAFSHELSYNANETDRQSYSDGLPTFGAEGELQRLSYLGSYRHSEGLRLVYGVDLQKEEIDNDGLVNKRGQDGYYAEYQGGFGNSLYVTAGLRYDDNEDFGKHTSYRLSGAYLFNLAGGELKLRGAVGTGFRAPSLYEVAYNSSFGFAPASDVDLKEETSAGYDIGLSWFADSGLYLEAVYFDQEVEDEISFDLEDYSGYLQGDGRSTSKGVELIAELTLLTALDLTANYTYNETETADGLSRQRRPEQLLNLGANWRLLEDRLVLGLNARGSYDAVDNLGNGLDDYTVFDINASFEVIEGLQVYGRIENLFDEDYEEVPTYNASGTAGYAGVRWSF